MEETMACRATSERIRDSDHDKGTEREDGKNRKEPIRRFQDSTNEPNEGKRTWY